MGEIINEYLLGTYLCSITNHRYDFINGNLGKNIYNLRKYFTYSDEEVFLLTLKLIILRVDMEKMIREYNK